MTRARVFVSAGETSGEMHAARLVTELRARAAAVLGSELAIDAFGGRIVATAGARLLFPLSDYAVMGFAAVFAQIGRFAGVLADFGRYLDAERPDLVVLIDYPGLHVRMAALAKRRGIPVAYYACPQLWAWAPWRARRFARVVDRALVILPFEERWFRAHGIDATYVGHPSADRAEGNGAAPREASPRPESASAAAAPLVALLPGSRPQEVRANLPLMLDVAERLRANIPAVRFALPQTRSDAAAACRPLLAERAGLGVALADALDPVLDGARFALVASGTVTFEVARRAVPMVVVYRVTRLQRALGRLLLTVPWISLVNLIAGREVVPEVVTADAPVDDVAALCRERIQETPVRAACVRALEETFRDAFRPGASARAADELLALLAAKSAE